MATSAMAAASTPERLVHERVELRFDRDHVWILHRGEEVARYPRSYEQGVWLPPPVLRPEPPAPPPPLPLSARAVAPPELATTRSCARDEDDGGRAVPYLHPDDGSCESTAGYGRAVRAGPGIATSARNVRTPCREGRPPIELLRRYRLPQEAPQMSRLTAAAGGGRVGCIQDTGSRVASIASHLFRKVGDVPPVLYAVCGEIDAPFLPVFYEWYARRHAPDVIGLGFWSARSYVGLESEQNVWDLYEIPGAEVFDRPEYEAMSNGDPGVAEALSHFGRRTVTLYDQVLIVGPKDGHAPLSGRFLTAIRLDGGRGIAEGYEDVVLAPLHGATGFVRGRLCARSPPQHPWWPTTEPEWCGIVEWDWAEAALEAHGREAATGAHEALGASRLSYNLVRLRYGLVRDDVWAP
jgi:hypothetical protein